MLTLGAEKMARSSSADRSAFDTFFSFFFSPSWDLEEPFFFFLVSRAAKMLLL